MPHQNQEIKPHQDTDDPSSAVDLPRPGFSRRHDSTTFGLRPVTQLAHKIIKPIIRRKGTALATLSLDWQDIVGPHLAKCLYPDKLSFSKTAAGGKSDGHLRLRVLDSFSHEFPFIRDQLMARINGYFGYNVVATLSMRQVHALPAIPSSPAVPHRIRTTSRLTSAPEPQLSDRAKDDLKAIDHEPLRQALAEMGQLLADT